MAIRPRHRRILPLLGGLSFSSYFTTLTNMVTWILQETSGDVAGATNEAATAPDTRNVATLTYAAYTAGANWANSSAQIARHTAGAVATIQQDGIIAAGKTWEYEVVISNRTAGTVTITDGGAAISATATVTITATGADVIITPSSDFDGDIDLAQGTVQQTGIADSDDFPGAELAVGANAVDDLGGNETNATTGWADAGALGVFASQNTIVSVGNYAIHAQSDSANDRFQKDIETDFALVTGKSYSLSFDWRHDGTGAGNGDWGWGFAQDGNATGYADINTIIKTATTFAQITHNFTYDGVNGWLIFIERNASNDGGIYFDNFSLTEQNPYDGDHDGVAAGQSGFGNIPVMAQYDGATSETDITGAEVDSTLYPDLFSFPISAQKDSWDTNKRWLFLNYVDANNYFGVATSATLGELIYEYRSEGMGAPVQIVYDALQTTALFNVIQTVKSGVMYAWYNGAIVGSASVAGGTFTGNYTKNFIGSGGGANYYLGKLAFSGFTTNRFLTDAESVAIDNRSGR